MLHLELDKNCQDNTIQLFADASWAASEGRKSTSGFLIEIQGFAMMTASKTQALVAKSTAESKLLSLNSGLSEALFLQSILSEMGEQASIQAWSDSSAAISALSKHGLGDDGIWRLSISGFSRWSSRGQWSWLMWRLARTPVTP